MSGDFDELFSSDTETDAPKAVRPTFNPLVSPDSLWGYGVTSLDTLRANELRVVYDLVDLFLAARVPITAWGPVGVGKTQKIRDYSYRHDENGTPYQVVLIAPSTEDPTAIHGIVYTSLAEDGSGVTLMKRSMPDIVKKILDHATSTWKYLTTTGSPKQVDTYLNEPPVDKDMAPDSLELVRTGGLSIVFMDEMTTCMPAQQNALLGFLTHSEFGGVSVGEFITIIMAANPPGTVSTVRDLSEAIINRGGHVPWYGDPQVWFDGWSDGFGVPGHGPGPDAVSLVKETMFASAEARSHIFRSDDWSVDDLVPYERMQNTPRTWDEFGHMVDFIHGVFDGGGSQVARDFYIARAAQALLGRQYGDAVSSAMERLRDAVSAEAIVARVRQAGITFDSTMDDVEGLKLHLMSNKSHMSADAEDALATDLMRMVTKQGFSTSTFIALWAFLVGTGDDNRTAGFHRHLVEAGELCRPGLESGALSRERLLPAFVSSEVKQMAKEARTRMREDGSL